MVFSVIGRVYIKISESVEIVLIEMQHLPLRLNLYMTNLNIKNSVCFLVL